MNLAQRLDAIESALIPTDAGSPCDTCGAPQYGDRRDIVHLFIGDELGTCEVCGRHLDMKRSGLPILGGKVIRLIRATCSSDSANIPNGDHVPAQHSQ